MSNTVKQGRVITGGASTMRIGTAHGSTIPVNSWKMTVIEETTVVEGTVSEPQTSALAPIDACEHPEITESQTVFGAEITIACKQCSKKIAIPNWTLIMAADEEESRLGIIGLAFGEAWRERIAAQRKQLRVERYIEMMRKVTG